ncbi:MAG: manganese efflux pump MntP family protein [Candidatus Celaenobacter polaris]|nr:manganese efflux pump MntP family protein [Candidatus Celaenobacter polaris]
MSLFQILLVAVGLAMDAFAVSLASGFSLKRSYLFWSCIIALFFGGFQALMPVIGWFGGNLFREYIEKFDHWIAFGLLIIIGCRMIYEAFCSHQEKKLIRPTNLFVLFGLAIATSIDALAVGLSFSLLDTRIFLPALLIGVVTFALSFCGVMMGKSLGAKWGERAHVFGGIVLILIGIKILFEHLT